MIITRNVHYKYPEQEELVFKDFCVSPSEALLITGPSGAGKSTLLHLLSGVLKPQTGSIVIKGSDLSLLSEHATDQYRGQNIGLIFQRPSFIESLTVRENIELHYWLATKKRADKKEILEILKQMDVGDLEGKKPGSLSVGQRQRVGIARAVMNKPAVLLADEPTSSLDDRNTQKVAEVLLNAVEKLNTSLIVVTHDYRLKAYFKNQMEL